jgi:hypothetical protein
VNSGQQSPTPLTTNHLYCALGEGNDRQPSAVGQMAIHFAGGFAFKAILAEKGRIFPKSV